MGNEELPGAGLIMRTEEADGTTVAALVRGDALDLYHGQGMITSVSLAPATARRLAWFILWRWWVLGTWLGLRAWLAERSLRRTVDAARDGANT